MENSILGLNWDALFDNKRKTLFVSNKLNIIQGLIATAGGSKNKAGNKERITNSTGEYTAPEKKREIVSNLNLHV